MYSISSRGRVCRFESMKLRSSVGGEVNLCDVGEEGKKSNALESSERRRRSNESGVCSDMVVDKEEVRSYRATAPYIVLITCFIHTASRDIY